MYNIVVNKTHTYIPCMQVESAHTHTYVHTYACILFINVVSTNKTE